MQFTDQRVHIHHHGGDTLPAQLPAGLETPGAAAQRAVGAHDDGMEKSHALDAGLELPPVVRLAPEAAPHTDRVDGQLPYNEGAARAGWCTHYVTREPGAWGLRRFPRFEICRCGCSAPRHPCCVAGSSSCAESDLAAPLRSSSNNASS